MAGEVIDLSAGTNILADGDFIGKEKIVMKCGETFSGSGRLQAPVITVTAKQFAFTGTIECDISCEITVKERFNPEMFKRQGKGKFIINVDPDLFSSSSSAVEPRTITICGVDFTLKNQADLDIVDAIERNDIDKLREVVEGNSYLSKDALAVFMIIAGHYNYMDAVKELIVLGADVNSDGLNLKKERPLLFAIVLKNAEFVRELVQAGADPNQAEGLVFSTIPPITYAVCDSDANCLIELLKAENIDVDAKVAKDGRTALMSAAYYGYKDKVRILLEAGADPSIKDHWNSAIAVEYASSKGHQDIAEFIKNFKTERNVVASRDMTEESVVASGGISSSKLFSKEVSFLLLLLGVSYFLDQSTR